MLLFTCYIYIPVTPGGYSSVDDYRWSMTWCHRQVPSVWYRLQNITNISSTTWLHTLSSTICNFCRKSDGVFRGRFCFKFLEKVTLQKESPQNTLSRNISVFQSLTYWIVYRSHRHSEDSALRLTSYRRGSSTRFVCLLLRNAWSTSCMIKCPILLVRYTHSAYWPYSFSMCNNNSAAQYMFLVLSGWITSIMWLMPRDVYKTRIISKKKTCSANI